ncbi:Sushi, nidogen and EGF-like domain-containing protein 1 [Exaiptasia diaphana]|nr:Sushi, nidogen and EGF-like domain-containing protein 1 [Exaiptasia diaphana]
MFMAMDDRLKKGWIWYRQTTIKRSLEVASNDVRMAFPEFPYFSATWMFVVTWEKVPIAGYNGNVTLTFQAVLLTDGRYSFVRFNYRDISWTYKPKENYFPRMLAWVHDGPCSGIDPRPNKL